MKISVETVCVCARVCVRGSCPGHLTQFTHALKIMAARDVTPCGGPQGPGNPGPRPHSNLGEEPDPDSSVDVALKLLRVFGVFYSSYQS